MRLRTFPAVFCLMAVSSLVCHGQEIPPRVLDRLKEGTVFIRVEGPRMRMTGSGFLLGKIGEDGYVITNAHVLGPPPRTRPEVIAELHSGLLVAPARGQPTVTVVFESGTKNERELAGAIVARDDSRDLAFLKGNAKSLPQKKSWAQTQPLPNLPWF